LEFNVPFQHKYGYIRDEPNTGGALCLTPRSLADADTGVPCNSPAKTKNPLTFAGVPKTRQQISAVSGPKFTIL